MPIYEFTCKNCQYNFEDLLSVNVKNPECPKCGSFTFKHVSRVFGIVKGSTNRTMDCVIGSSAEKRWKIIEERKNKRMKNSKLEIGDRK